MNATLLIATNTLRQTIRQRLAFRHSELSPTLDHIQVVNGTVDR